MFARARPVFPLSRFKVTWGGFPFDYRENSRVLHIIMDYGSHIGSLFQIRRFRINRGKKCYLAHVSTILIIKSKLLNAVIVHGDIKVVHAL